MTINMNLAEKATLENGFDLFDAVKKEAYSMSKEEKKQIKKNTKMINELVVDCQTNFTNEKFNYLLSLIYRAYDIHLKIVETTAGSNTNFLAEDDYFQLYSQVLWKCIRTYNSFIGDFKNFFIKNFRVTFLTEKRDSFMKVRGYVEEEKRTPKRIIVFDNFDDSLGNYSSEISTVESGVFMDKILSCLDEEERDVIKFTFLSTDNGKPRSNKEVTEKFNITVNRFQYLKGKAFKKIRKYYPSVLDDFMYDKSDKIIEFLPVKEEFDVNSSLDETKAS